MGGNLTDICSNAKFHRQKLFASAKRESQKWNLRQAIPVKRFRFKESMPGQGTN
jgi:hypothetical protein